MERSSSRAVAPSLLLFAILYGGMVPLGGFLGPKQVSLGSLAVEAGIFPFLTLIAISSGTPALHGRAVAHKPVRLAECRVGQEWVRTCILRARRLHSKKQ